MFQPLKHMGFVTQPVGRAVMQLFFVSHFYLRLGWLLVNERDFYGIPRSWRGKMRKRAVSSIILAGCLVASQHVGWARDDLPMLRRALPSGLALGSSHAPSRTSSTMRAVRFANDCTSSRQSAPSSSQSMLTCSSTSMRN